MGKHLSNKDKVKELVLKLQQKGVEASLCKRPNLNLAINAK